MQHVLIWFNNLFPSWMKENISLISGILDILQKIVIPVAIILAIYKWLRNHNARRALNRMATMNDKVEEYKNSASVLMSVATESICWLVAAFSFVIMWCISIALEPVRKLTRCCSDRPSRSTDHAATTSILRLVAAFSNASKFSRPLAPLTPLSAYSTTICHPRRAHPLNTRAPARARGEQAERWAEGLGIISGGVLLRSPAAAKAAALPTRTKSLSSQLHQTLLMEKVSIRMRKPSPPSMQRFVRYRRSLSGKPLLSRLFGRRVDALILDRAADLARELKRDNLADER